MREASALSYQAQEHPDARKFARSRIDFRGVVLDCEGAPLTDCTIKDLSVIGAQVMLPTSQPIPERVYLIDVTNDLGYDARVAWWRPYRAGLAFQKEYALGEGAPEHLEFLNRVVTDTKLALVESHMAEGKSLADAVRLAGLSGATYARLAAEYARDQNLAETVWRLNSENASLRKLLLEKQGA